MPFQFNRMAQQEAEQIAFTWLYDAPYDFYNMEEDEEDLAAFLDDKERGEFVFSVKDGEELIGFLMIEHKGDTVDIGLGMRPDLTGQGKGVTFLKAAMSFLRKTYEPKQLTLSVATFNKRAIKLYKRMGFHTSHIYIQETNGSTYEFMSMVFDCYKSE
ncbi:GNAT family N-acetyltransferase [Cytobacillus sp. Sa5YUA1]|uniref:GNAT family N-acetyltransferase n=1 Tax=Cytobacillus stercorigallinarum TaxID=2762240 RepID=A0ABR8QPN5_9BACI|nr:GNAT family protein [Cytobacillus stercorigallinarum]MBD7937496.1 GNAT family N-acetyltransferase [Cytobacillus stercorigallinarum]